MGLKRFLSIFMRMNKLFQTLLCICAVFLCSFSSAQNWLEESPDILPTELIVRNQVAEFWTFKTDIPPQKRKKKHDFVIENYDRAISFDHWEFDHQGQVFKVSQGNLEVFGAEINWNYKYDAAGNLIHENYLSRIAYEDGGPPYVASEGHADHQYNELGQRVRSSSVDKGLGIVTEREIEYQWDEHGRLLKKVVNDKPVFQMSHAENGISWRETFWVDGSINDQYLQKYDSTGRMVERTFESDEFEWVHAFYSYENGWLKEKKELFYELGSMNLRYEDLVIFERDEGGLVHKITHIQDGEFQLETRYQYAFFDK